MSRVGIAATMLRDGNTVEHVARTMRMTVLEVEAIARDVDAGLAKTGALPRPTKPRKPAKPLLQTPKSKAIREAVAAIPERKKPYCRVARPALSPESRSRRRWSASDDARLVELMKHHTHAEIGKILGRSSATVAWRASTLKLANRQTLLGAMNEAYQLLKKKDHVGALNCIEAVLKTKGDKPCSHKSKNDPAPAL